MPPCRSKRGIPCCARAGLVFATWKRYCTWTKGPCGQVRLSDPPVLPSGGLLSALCPGQPGLVGGAWKKYGKKLRIVRIILQKMPAPDAIRRWNARGHSLPALRLFHRRTWLPLKAKALLGPGVHVNIPHTRHAGRYRIARCLVL